MIKEKKAAAIKERRKQNVKWVVTFDYLYCVNDLNYVRTQKKKKSINI